MKIPEAGTVRPEEPPLSISLQLQDWRKDYGSRSNEGVAMRIKFPVNGDKRTVW